MAGFPYDPDAVYHGHDNVSIQEIRKAALIRAGRQATAIDQFGQWYLKANATEEEDLPDSVYYDGAQTDYAVRKLAALRDAGQPFFFAVGYYRPHLPFNAPKRYWDLYKRDALPLAPNQMVPAGAPGMAVNTNRELRGYADFANAKDAVDGTLDVKTDRLSVGVATWSGTRATSQGSQKLTYLAIISVRDDGLTVLSALIVPSGVTVTSQQEDYLAMTNSVMSSQLKA